MAEVVKLGSLLAVPLGKILDFPVERKLEWRINEQWYGSQTWPLVLPGGLFAAVSLLGQQGQDEAGGGPERECLRLAATHIWNLGWACHRCQQRLTPEQQARAE